MSEKKPQLKPLFNLEALKRLSPLEREKALEAIGIIDAFEGANPLFFYNHPILSEKPPHEKQLAFHGMKQRYRAFFGGNQSGKTTAGLVDDIVQAIDEDAVPDHLKFMKKFQAPFYCRILATDMVTLELTLYQKIKDLVPKEQLVGGKWERAFHQQQRVLRFANGSMFQFMTYKQEVSTMGGATLDRIHYDEEPPEDVAQENRLRIMRRGGDEILTMTPLLGLTWTYNAIAKKYMVPEFETKPDSYWESDEVGITLVDMDDNPYLSEEDKHHALRDYPPEIIEARKRGRFIHFAGLIYGEFDRNVHVIDDADVWDQVADEYGVENTGYINPGLNVIVGIDPGIRNRCAVVWAALDGNDDLYVFDELYEQGRTIGEICEMIQKINAKYQINPIYYVIDPASRNKNFQTGRSDQSEFAEHGILTVPGQHQVEAGINRVKERLRRQKLFIFSNCRNLITEFEEYRWKDPSRTGEDGKPQPVKTKDHAMDALRYLIMSRPYLPEEYRSHRETELQRMMREDQERGNIGRNEKSQFGPGIFA